MVELEIENLSEGKIAMWNPEMPGQTALIYTPPTDNMQRYYNSP